MKAPIVYFDTYMLRDVSLKDAKHMYEYGSDLDVVKTLSWGPYVDPMDAVYAIKHFFLKRPKKGLPVGYAIIDTTIDKMIGTIDFHTRRPDGSLEIGYALNQTYWNKGIMSKCLSYMLKIGFFYFNVDKIVIGHAKSNIASQRVIEKNHFKFHLEEENKFYNRFNGTYEAIRWYQLTKEQYIYENQ